MRIKANRKRGTFLIEAVSRKVVDRGSVGEFGVKARPKITPDGRPSDLFGDVYVSVARVRFLENDDAGR